MCPPANKRRQLYCVDFGLPEITERDMARNLLVLASIAAASTAFASAAHACLSCSYTPEVLNSPGVRSAAPERRERSSSVKEERRSRSEESSSSRHNKEAKRKSRDEDTEAATVAPKKEVPEASTENSAITTTGSAIASQVKGAITTPERQGPQNENSTISTAVAGSGKPAETNTVGQVTTADKNVGCKKYFPSTGLTLSVPCEQ